MLTDLQLADIRRHLGFGPIGDATGLNGGSFISYRFFVTQGLLEFRIAHLSEFEEQILVGSGDPDAPVNPSFTNPADDTLIQGYLNICNFLEGQIATSTDNLDTDRAGEWVARRDEINHRSYLYNWWCSKMAQFLYVPMGRPLSQFNRGAMVN